MTDKYRPLKDALGCFATGIAVAACKKKDGSLAALTINSFTSVSLEPPLVLWCLENRASSYSTFMEVESYGVSILRSDQQDISARFSRYLPEGPDENDFEVWGAGAPVLKQRLAAFDCKIVSRHDAGDHVILVGKVIRFDSEKAAPLIYHASNYLSDQTD